MIGRKLVQVERERDTSFHGAAADERMYRDHMLAKAKASHGAPGGYVLIIPEYNERGIIWPHHLTIARLLSVCGRRRNLSVLHKRRAFYRRWLRMFENGTLKYLESIDKDGNWHDLRTRKHAVAAKAYSTVIMQSPELNAQILLAAVAEEIGAVGNFWIGDPIPEPEPEPLPLPMPSPDADKEGSGEAGSAGAAGSANGMPKPRPEADKAAGPRVIDLTEEELAELLDEVSSPMPGGMFR